MITVRGTLNNIMHKESIQGNRSTQSKEAGDGKEWC